MSIRRRQQRIWQCHRNEDVDLALSEFNGIGVEAFILLVGKSVHHIDITTFGITKSLKPC